MNTLLKSLNKGELYLVESNNIRKYFLKNSFGYFEVKNEEEVKNEVKNLKIIVDYVIYEDRDITIDCIKTSKSETLYKREKYLLK